MKRKAGELEQYLLDHRTLGQLNNWNMNKLTLTIVLMGFLCPAYAQFEGTLYYECTLRNQTLTTLYSSRTKILLESKTYPMKEGAADISKAKEQDPLIFDFEAKKLTRLSSRHKEAVTSGLAPVTVDRSAKLVEGDVVIDDLGAEKIGGYSCHHYSVKIKNKQSDLWITKDLGVTPLCMVSEFDYYPEGSSVYDKLKAAGGDGVVVKVQSGTLVINLSSVQHKTVPPSFFEIPEGYSKN